MVKIVADEVGLVGKTSAKKELDDRIRRIWMKDVFDPIWSSTSPTGPGRPQTYRRFRNNAVLLVADDGALHLAPRPFRDASGPG